MRTLLCLAMITLTIRHSSAGDAKSATDDEQQPSSMTLRELLNAYQVLYERQFHEPLPENQKALLATLPRFNGDSTHKARKSVNWGRSFQQDGDVDKDGEELTGLAVVEKREASSEPTATTIIEKTEGLDEPTATTMVEKREIASEAPPTEKISGSTAAPSVKSTTAGTSAVSKGISETATKDVIRTTMEEEQSSTISSGASTPPSSISSISTVASTTASTSTNFLLQSDPVKTTQSVVQNVQGRKLTDLHPELKNAIEGKVKPVIVQEVKAALKPTEATATESSQTTQPQENTSEPTKIVLSRPLAVMPKKEIVQLPKVEVTTVIQSTTAETTKREKLSIPPTTNSIVLAGDARSEMKSKMPVMKMTKSTVQPMKTRKILPSRQNEQQNRRANSGGRVAMVKPMTRQQQQQQQRQPNLRVVNHVIVPATLQKRVPAQNGQAVQNRRPQMQSRRASLPARPLLTPAADLKPTNDNRQPTNTPSAPRSNLIVIRDGRIVQLTEQQQKDLNVILSAMGAQDAEPSSRRRAPVRRERTPNRLFRQRQPFRKLHA